MVPRSLRKGQKGSEEKKKKDEEIKEVEMERTEQEPVDWSSLTVSKLKEVCKELGLTVGGKKADIIKRIEDHKAAQNAASVDSDGGGVEWSEIAETEPEAQKEKEDDEPTDSRVIPNTVEEVLTPEDAEKMPEEVVTPDEEAEMPEQEVAEEMNSSIAKSSNSELTDEEDNAEDKRSEAEAEVEALLGSGSDDEHHNDVVEPRKRTFDQTEDDALEGGFNSAPPKKQANQFFENGSCSMTSVKIDNFVRPFTLKQACDLVEQAAGKDGLELSEKTFFMNKIKTYAIVTLPSKECTDRVIDALEGLQWPEHSVKRLNVTISNMSALEAAAEMSRQDVVRALEVIGRPPRSNRSTDGISKSSAAALDREGGERVVEREVKPGVVEREARSQVAEQGPDKLFQKTTSVPPIYWIPLSEEDASLKRVRIELEKAKASKKHGGNDDRDRSIEGRGKHNSSDRSQDRERARSYSVSSGSRSRDRSSDRGRDQSMDSSRDRSKDRSFSRRRSRSRGSNRNWRRSHMRSRSRDRSGYSRGGGHRRRDYSPDRFMNRRKGGDARRSDICYGWEAGHCRFGSNCRFYHDDSRRGGGRRSPPRRGGGAYRQQPCRDYGRGNCRYGEDCRFLH